MIAGVGVGGGGGRRVGRHGHAGGLGTAQTQPCFAGVHTETDWLAGRSQAGEQHASSHTQQTRAVGALGGWGGGGSSLQGREWFYQSLHAVPSGKFAVSLCDVTKGHRYSSPGWLKVSRPARCFFKRTLILVPFQALEAL